MANLVYNMVCDAFAGMISHRAAENLVKDALRDIGSHPDRVTALEMQELLRRGIFKRLQKIIPTMQAKGEIKRLLRQIEKTLAQPQSPTTEGEDDWEEPEAEAVDLSKWGVGVGEAPAAIMLPAFPDLPLLEQDTTIKLTQSDIPELEAVGAALEQLPSSPLSPAQKSVLEVDVVSSDSDSVQSELVSLEIDIAEVNSKVNTPIFGTPIPANAPTFNADSNASSTYNFSELNSLEINGPAVNGSTVNDPSRTIPTISIPEAVVAHLITNTTPLPSVLAPSLSNDSTLPRFQNTTEVSPKSSEDFDNINELASDDADDLNDGDDGFADDFGAIFDFDSPDFNDAGVAHVPLEPKPILREGSKQDEIFSVVALEAGVSDVMLSTREGKLLGAKVSRLDAPKLCRAVSQLAAGADGGIPPGLIYLDIGEQWVTVAPLDDQVLLTVLCASNTNIGKLLAQIITIREGL